MRLASFTAAALLVASTGAFSQNMAFVERTEFNVPEGTLPSSCNADDAVNQALVAGNFGTAWTSDVGADFLTADNAAAGGAAAMFPAGEVITEVKVWGLQLEFAGGFVGPCDETQADFTVGAWTDNAGAPDVLLDSATATPSAINDTGIGFALGANIIEFTIPVPAGINSDGATWFSVQREASPDTTGGGQCFWLWVNNTDTAVGDNTAISINTGDGSLIPRTEDSSSCVTTGAGLPESQPVPANSPWALLLLLAALGGVGLVAVRRFA